MLAGILLATALLLMLAALIAVNWRPSFHDFPMQGIDVGERHGVIDWRLAHDQGGVRFAYVRATIGARGRDRRFSINWHGAFEAGVRRGALHIFSLCQLAADQAVNLVSRVRPIAEDLPFAIELDFEPDCTARPDRDVVLAEIRRFLADVEGLSGKLAVLKVSRAFEDRYRVSAAIPRPMWSSGAFFPPSYFDKPWRIWQASTFRRVAGVAGPVNWNVMARWKTKPGN
ncbi:glycoside hydrolase family 25 protein [Sphingomonas canadensis]|uniref:Glycoside hydrolase family 25 protein n=1 Tax=Sphingomonas canadensis TaxID=1219257 RepID=A0ABW3HDB0_9SPHN|nr:GH25 family lysozyme [Sphingomonas canadensis]MCW3838041.1 GH25 family lysozyme [Sphingomonas canadensis]